LQSGQHYLQNITKILLTNSSTMEPTAMPCQGKQHCSCMHLTPFAVLSSLSLKHGKNNCSPPHLAALFAFKQQKKLPTSGVKFSLITFSLSCLMIFYKPKSVAPSKMEIFKHYSSFSE